MISTNFKYKILKNVHFAIILLELKHCDRLYNDHFERLQKLREKSEI